MNDTTALAATLNHNLSLLTLIGGAALLMYAVYLTYSVCKKKLPSCMHLVARFVYPIGFFVTLIGSWLTLYYSEYLGYAPCDLCWYQRIFLYPQVFMFAYAWYKKDTAVFPYTIILSVIGGAIAFYHHLLQMDFNVLKPCSSAPFAVDCAKPSFIEFGFVSFPFMAFVLFSGLLLLSLTALFAKRYTSK